MQQTQTDEPQPIRLQSFDRLDGWLLLLLTVGCFALFVYGIGSYPLWDPWEPKYGAAMAEMLERGDLITPWFNGKVRWTKPILIYWAMAVPMALWENNEFAARLPSALGACLGVFVLFYGLRRLRGRRTALVAACVLMTIPQYFFMARQAMPDALFVAFLAAAMTFLALGRFGDTHRRPHLMLFWASLALAFLTKGPLALAIVGLAVVLYWMIDLAVFPKDFRQLRAVLEATARRYAVGPGLLVFAAIAGPWYGAMLLIHGQRFVDAFIVGENLMRFREPVRGHHGLATHYIRVLLHGMYPWFSFLPLALLTLSRGRTRVDEEVRQRWFYFAWFFSAFLVITSAGTKIDHYILPLTPALAVLVALAWESWLSDDPPFWVAPAFVLALLLTTLPIRDFLVESTRYTLSVFVGPRPITGIPVDGGLRLFLAAWAIAMVLALSRRAAWVAAGLAICIAYGNALWFTQGVLPRHSTHRTMKYYVDHFENTAPPDSELVFYGKTRYSMHYYRGVDRFAHFESDQLNRLLAYLRDRPEAYVIVEGKHWAALNQRLGRETEARWKVLRHEHPRYVLAARPDTRVAARGE